MDAYVGPPINPINSEGCKVYFYYAERLESVRCLGSYDRALQDAREFGRRVFVHDGWTASGDSRWTEVSR